MAGRVEGEEELYQVFSEREKKKKNHKKFVWKIYIIVMILICDFVQEI